MCYSLPQTGCVSREQAVVKQFAFIMPICTSNLWQSAGLTLLRSVLPITIKSTLLNGHYSNSFQLLHDSISDPRSHLLCNLLGCASEIKFPDQSFGKKGAFSALILFHFLRLKCQNCSNEGNQLHPYKGTFCDCSFSCQTFNQKHMKDL